MKRFVNRTRYYSLTGDVSRLSDAAVHDDALVVAVFLEDGDLDDFSAIRGEREMRRKINREISGNLCGVSWQFVSVNPNFSPVHPP